MILHRWQSTGNAKGQEKKKNPKNTDDVIWYENRNVKADTYFLKMLGMNNKTGSDSWKMGPNRRKKVCNPIDKWMWQICGKYSDKVASCNFWLQIAEPLSRTFFLLNSFQTFALFKRSLWTSDGEWWMHGIKQIVWFIVSLICKYWGFSQVLNELNDDNEKKNIYLF